MLKNLATAALTAVFALLALIPLHSAPTKPMQIFLPGGFKGQLAQITDKHGLEPSPQLLIPQTIERARSRQKSTVVYVTGDMASPLDPLSFFSRGKQGRELAEACVPDALAISASDLEGLDLAANKDFVHRCVLSNALGKSYQSPFLPWAQQEIDGRRLWFFNFVSALECQNLGLERWNDFELIKPSLALRRLAPELSASDISLVTVYGSVSEVEEVAEWFRRAPGVHLIMHRASAGQKSSYPSYGLEFEGNICVFALEFDEKSLPMVNLFFKTRGTPRITLRSLPLKGELDSAQKKSLKSLQEGLLEPITLIKTETMPSTAIKKIDAKILAQWVRDETRAEAAIMLEAEQEYFSENVVRVGTVVKYMTNDRVFVLRVRGQAVARILSELHQNSSWVRWHSAGCEYKYYQGRLLSLKINKRALEADGRYNLAVTQKTLENPVIKAIFEEEEFEVLHRKLLWELVLSQLRRGGASHEAIFYKGLK